MIYGIKKVAKYLLGIDIAGRGLAVRPDDTFIVSYPRSGNTWTRFLIANLLHPSEPVGFSNIERLIPDAEAQSSLYLKRLPSPRVIKSHEYFDHRYPRVIYIVRDPRDVVLSYYDFERKYRSLEDGFPLDSYVAKFVGGQLKSSSWGTWAENVGTWIAARQGTSCFLLLRYEDLMGETETELRKVAQFFGMEVSPERLHDVKQRSSVERMRELEKSEGNNWVTTRHKRPDIPFIGTASAGRWKSVLSPAAVAKIESAWGPLMLRLGYELDMRVAADHSRPDKADSLQNFFSRAECRRS
jgi:hypothetical protein